MYTTLELLELIKSSNGNCSNYRAAQILEINKATISSWVCGRSYMSEETAVKIAKKLGLNVDLVVASIHAESHKDDDLYPVWKRICEGLQMETAAT